MKGYDQCWQKRKYDPFFYIFKAPVVWANIHSFMLESVRLRNLQRPNLRLRTRFSFRI